MADILSFVELPGRLSRPNSLRFNHTDSDGSASPCLERQRNLQPGPSNESLTDEGNGNIAGGRGEVPNADSLTSVESQQLPGRLSRPSSLRSNHTDSDGSASPCLERQRNLQPGPSDESLTDEGNGNIAGICGQLPPQPLGRQQRSISARPNAIAITNSGTRLTNVSVRSLLHRGHSCNSHRLLTETTVPR